MMSCYRFQILAVLLFLLAITSSVSSAELDISELIAGIKQSITEAQKTAAQPHMVIPWIEAEISYVVKKDGEGRFTLYVVTAGGNYAIETVQRVKFRLEPEKGKPLKVETPPREWIAGFTTQGKIEDSIIVGIDHTIGKVFFSSSGDMTAFPIKVGKDTKIIDTENNIKSLNDLEVGIKGTLNTGRRQEAS